MELKVKFQMTNIYSYELAKASRKYRVRERVFNELLSRNRVHNLAEVVSLWDEIMKRELMNSRLAPVPECYSKDSSYIN